MLRQRLRRGLWERRFVDLSATRHISRQFRQLAIFSGDDRPARGVPFSPITAKAGERREKRRQEKQRQERRVGKNCQRLSKVLAQWGFAARRKAEEIIAKGRVSVNGKRVTVPQTVVQFTRDKITVDGQRIRYKPPKTFYFAVNKPAGYTCTSAIDVDEDGKRRKIVLDLFAEWLQEQKEKCRNGAIPPRLFTVGRLDRDSKGLIFVTNDGQWAQKISHPSSGLTKEYVVHTSPEATMADIREIGKGCEVDGKYVVPVGVMKETEFLRVVVEEGRNREVRTLVENSGLLVKSLKRVRIGGYRMPSGHKNGKIRVVQAHERRRMMNPGSLN